MLKNEKECRLFQLRNSFSSALFHSTIQTEP